LQRIACFALSAFTMKMDMSMIVVLAIAAQALANGAITSDTTKPSKDPVLGDTFRSDTTLRFMRGLRRHGQDPLKDLQQGPNADSKKAQKAADKVAEEQQTQEDAGGKEANPLEKAADAVEDAVDAKPQDAVDAAGLKDLQQGPNADSKKAQKAADKVADKQKELEKSSPTAKDPLEQAGDAIEDAVDDAVDTVAGGETQKKDAKTKKKASPAAPEAKAPEAQKEPSASTCKNSPEDWIDTKGNDCEDYAEGEWCNRHGGYGDGWLDDWGSFEDVAKKGETAKEVCCVCGGGDREDESPEADAPAAAPAAAAPIPAMPKYILGSKAGRPLQAQGYAGDPVVHEDRKTMTEDWGLEFGPHAGHRDIKTICQENPGNEWCSLHGYYDGSRHSAASSTSVGAIFAAMLLACLR